MNYFLSALLAVVTMAAACGFCVFAFLLGARGWDAHEQRVARVRRHRP